VQLVPLETVRDHGGHDLLERVRLSQPGQIQFDGMLWDRLFGAAGTEEIKNVRVARYDDEDGMPQGFAAYQIGREPHLEARLEVKYLLTATDDAYAGLWRFLLEMDLVTSVTAAMRPVDEPVRWQVTDARAVAKTAESDHLWARILDVRAALEARSYGAPGRFVLEVDDALGFAAGRYLLDIAGDGSATVGTTDEDADLALGVAELAAVYLGGTPVTTLARAGRITELRDGAATAADASFHSAVTPWLSIWF
jgi:predicted acetyltransferase